MDKKAEIIKIIQEYNEGSNDLTYIISSKNIKIIADRIEKL
jgi:hypothetical protein